MFTIQVVWKGYQEEGMSYEKKQHFVYDVEVLLFLNRHAKEQGIVEDRLTAEGDAYIKKLLQGSNDKHIKTFQKYLPKEILEEVTYWYSFSLGYFNEATAQKLQRYVDENVIKTEK